MVVGVDSIWSIWYDITGSGSNVRVLRDYYYLVSVEVNKSCFGISVVPDDEWNKLRPITAQVYLTNKNLLCSQPSYLLLVI